MGFVVGRNGPGVTAGARVGGELGSTLVGSSESGLFVGVGEGDGSGKDSSMGPAAGLSFKVQAKRKKKVEHLERIFLLRPAW